MDRFGLIWTDSGRYGRATPSQSGGGCGFSEVTRKANAENTMSTATAKPPTASPASTPAPAAPAARPAVGVDDDVLAFAASTLGLSGVIEAEDTPAPVTEGEEVPASEEEAAVPAGEEGGEVVETAEGEEPPVEEEAAVEAVPAPEGISADVWTAMTPEAQGIVAAKFTEATEAQARIQELTTQLATEQGQKEIHVADVHPMFLVDDQAQLDQYEQRVQGALEFCVKHFDGYEGDGTDKDPAIPKEVIREKYAALDALQKQQIPRARQRMALQAQVKGELPKLTKTVDPLYENMGKPGTQENTVVQAFIRTVPQIKQLPNWQIVVGDSFLGQRVRQAAQADPKLATALKTILTWKQPTAKSLAAAPGKTTTTPKPAPKLPIAPAAGSKGGAVAPRKPNGAVNVSRFIQGGGGQDALAKELIVSGLV